MAKKEFDEIRLSGLLALLHKLVMFVTLPFRKFWKTVSVLVAVLTVLIIVPTLYGVEFRNIVSWYKTKLTFYRLSSIKQKTVDSVQAKVDAVKEIVGLEKSEDDNVSTKRYAVWNISDSGKKKKAKIPPQAGQRVYEKPQAIHADSAVQEAEVKTAIAVEGKKIVPEYHPYVKKKNDTKAKVVEDEKTVAVARKKLSEYYNILINQRLEYIKEPQEHSGTATVVGSNSLYVADTFVYLYGIYSDPKIHDLVKAQEYLVDLTNDKQVDCYVVAYTVQTQTATALCFVENVLLNQALVDKYLADNVALK